MMTVAPLAGAEMLAPARAMRQAIHEIELRAAGKREGLEGTVRVTSCVAVGTHHLPSIIADLRQQEPLITIELHVSDESSNLHFREAEIAVRMYRPTQLELVAQYLGELRLSVFAAKSYAERRGLPKTVEDILLHDVVGMDRGSDILEGFRQAGHPVDRDWFKVRCDDHAAQWQLVRAGCGIGFAQVSIGRKDPELVEAPRARASPTTVVAHGARSHPPDCARAPGLGWTRRGLA